MDLFFFFKLDEKKEGKKFQQKQKNVTDALKIHNLIFSLQLYNKSIVHYNSTIIIRLI